MTYDSDLKSGGILMKKLIKYCSCILACVFFLFCFPMIGKAEASEKIVNGVYIDQVNISGMTQKEAEAAVSAYVDELKQKGVAILVDQEVVYATVGDMGMTFDYGNCLEEALGLGQEGNLIKRYKDLKDIEHGNVVYPMTISFDKDKITEFVQIECAAYDIAPINAGLKRSNGAFVYTNHKVGRKVNVNETSNIIYSILLNQWDRMDVIVEAIVEDSLPKYMLEDVEKCNTIIGSFSTNYKTSSENRAGNLANGARLINGSVLYPGETFSAYEKLAPIDSSNGFYVAGAYSSGKVVDSVGGGVCQVSTTLYNAVLAAELEIVQRQEHSMSVSYVPLARDAAIAGTYKDLKFKNNTKVPIYIEAYTKNRDIYFNVWGYEDRPSNRTIEFESVTLLKTDPPADVITKDSSKPNTYYKVTQSAHYGYKTELYKVVYIDGVEKERVLINKSSYQSAPSYVTIGTMKVPDPVDEVEDKTGNKKPKPSEENQNPSTDEIIGEEE